jgi:hypothetical protein
MKTLETRKNELAAQAAVVEASDLIRADKEANLARVLALDIQQYDAGKTGMQVSVHHNVITLQKHNLDTMKITVAAPDDGDLAFSVAAQNHSSDKCSEDAVLDAILKWLR